MGVFCEMLSEDMLRANFRNSKKVLMITCPGCACESLSYTEGFPCRSLEQGKDMVHSAIAVHRVRDKWDSILTEMNVQVSHVTVMFPCEMFDTDRDLILNKIYGNDTIAVLACFSGHAAIKNMLSDFGGKIVLMMKTTGLFVFRLVPDETGKNSIVDQNTTKIVHFSDVTKPLR